jgi:hypothetical protein
MQPIQLDIFNLRAERQKYNNKLAVDRLIARDLTKHINTKEYQRILKDIDVSESELLDKCVSDKCFAQILGGRIAIEASRQGAKDEELQIITCGITSSKFGIIIENLSAVDFRPTKTGEIISSKEFKEKKILKNDCLKSFDAKITGKKNGWIFAKVVIGDGGHQDNVFEEAHSFCEWVKQFGNPAELFIVLIDTNLTAKVDELKQKYTEISNIVIGNHIEVQQYFIDNYTCILSDADSK